MTRRVKAAGPNWSVQEKCRLSQGTWADGARVERLREELLLKRASEGFARRAFASR